MGRKRKVKGSDSDDDEQDPAEGSSRRSPRILDITDRNVASSSNWKTEARKNERIQSSSENDFKSIDVNPNPFLNVLILKSFFGFCTPATLAACRLVCKLWLTESLSTWRSTATLQIIDSGSIGLDNWASKEPTSLPDFGEYLKALYEIERKKPYRHAQLYEWRFDDTTIEEDHPNPNTDGRGTRREIWNLLAPNLTTLKLSYCKFSHLGHLLQIIQQSCPLLQSLQLNENKFRVIVVDVFGEPNAGRRHPIERQYTSPVLAVAGHNNLKSLTVLGFRRGSCAILSWFNLLSQFPFLKSLTVNLRLNQNNKELLHILRAIMAIRQKDGAKLKNLTKFDFGGLKICQDERSRKVADLLHDLRLPIGDSLEFLLEPRRGNGVTVTYWVSLTDFKNLLEDNGPSLRSIVASIPSPDHIGWNWNPPIGRELSNLHTMELRVDGLCLNLGFMRHTPNLKQLMIANTDSWEGRNRKSIIPVSNVPKWEMHNPILSKLKSLQLEFVITLDDLRRLTLWIPTVKRLRMFLTDEQFTLVCKVWKGLEELKVYGEALTDVGVTGGKLHGGGTNPPALISKEIQEKEPQQNVSAFQDLEAFHCDSKLTDVSVVYGFLKLSKLRQLHLPNSKIGNDAQYALSEKNVGLYSKINCEFP